MLISNPGVPQHELSLVLVEAQVEQNNVTATDMTNMTDSVIPNAQEVNESNLELIKICTNSPNPECDNNMISIHNDCVAYPQFVAVHIPSCDDSRLISYLIARGILE